MDTEAHSHSLSTFVVTPNYSMSWHENKMLLASLTIVSFSIAGGFALQGFWLILPFAGFEILMLAGILYWCNLNATRCEVISIEESRVTIESGRKNTRQLYEFERAWTKVELQPPGRPHWPTRLVLRSKGKELEIGACLNNDERKSLAASIRKALVPTV